MDVASRPELYRQRLECEREHDLSIRLKSIHVPQAKV